MVFLEFLQGRETGRPAQHVALGRLTVLLQEVDVSTYQTRLKTQHDSYETLADTLHHEDAAFIFTVRAVATDCIVFIGVFLFLCDHNNS